jgi:hypothetical protein
MPIKISAALLALILLAGAIFGAVKIGQVVTSDHDGWDIFAPVPVTTDPIQIDPGDLLSKKDREDLEKVVNEARTYGIPWSVHVITDSDLEQGFSADDVAAERYAAHPVETSEDAGDGLLVLVIVTEPDHTQSQVGFATGPNFYPRGGITPERLRYIADVQMGAMIEEDHIGDAVIEGDTWIEWAQLFEPTPDPPPTKLETGLRDLLVPFGALGFGALAFGVLSAALAATWLTRRGGVATGGTTIDNGVAMAALKRGRVDRPVLAGAVLDALDRGALTFVGIDRLGAGNAAATSRDGMVLSAIAEIEARGGSPTPYAVGRYLAADGTLRRDLEDRLSAEGAFYRRSPVVTVWLRGIAAAGTLLGIVAIVVSVLGEAAPALAAAIALTVISLVTLIWNERRSWATTAGRKALASWLAPHQPPEDRERALFETITGMESVDLRPEHRSPLRPAGQDLATTIAL